MTDWPAVVVPLLSSIFGAVIGGILVHRLTLIREVRGARREQRTDYLVHAYRRLADAVNRPEGLTNEQKSDVEASLSDIVLLGDAQEVEAALQFMVDMDKDSGADLGAVISALRSSLRREIDLPAIDLPRLYNLRLERN